MVPPGAGDLVDHRFQRVRIVGDERDREVGRHEGVDDGQEGQPHQPERRHGEQARRPAFSPQPEHTLSEGQSEREEGREMAGFDHPPASSGFNSRGW